MNRLLTKVPDPSLTQPTDTFTYTPTGKRASMADASGSTTYTYDNRDHLTSEATPEGTLSYTYDLHGNVLTLASSNANGASLTYTYDALNRLATATDNRWVAKGGTSGLTTYIHDSVGNLTGYTYPNGLQTSLTYDALNRLTQAVSAKSGTTLSNYAYTLGLAGNRTAVTESTSRAVNYSYDPVYKMTSEAITNDPSGKNGTVSYSSYDAVGNRLQMTSTLGAVPAGTFSYDNNDRLTTDTYDADGNTVSSAGIANNYDFENHMLTHGAVTMVYDGDGNRVSETVGGTTTKYLVDSLNPTGYPQVIDELVGGAVTRTYAFGMPVSTTGTTPNNFLYSGEQFDSSLGLYYLRARYYNPAAGRFLAMDPYAGHLLQPATLHKYVYAQNDPVDGVDPTGRDAIIEVAFMYARPGFGVLAQGRIQFDPVGKRMGLCGSSNGCLRVGE